MRARLGIATVALLLGGICRGAEAPVELELVTSPGSGLTSAHSWLDALKGLPGTTLRIRSGGSGDRPSVENRGTATAPRYRVLGILTGRNRLKLPGGEFSLSDRAGVARWLEQLRRDGEPGQAAGPSAFGLNSAELVAIHDRLARSLTFETKDRRAGDVARQIVRDLSISVDVTPEASRAFRRNETALDELKGLSAGTALAALLRPLGLVMAPRKSPAGDVRLLITEFGQIDESWPVGWPTEESPYKVAPSLFEKIDVEIDKATLADTLAAIQQRVETPFLFDHNGLARKQIDPAETRVSFPAGRKLYQKVINAVLFQAQLKNELRVDEAGRPFLWISSLAP